MIPVPGTRYPDPSPLERDRLAAFPAASLTLEGGQASETLPMDYAGGIYIRQIDSVDEDFTYAVSAGDFESLTYRVTVLKAPRPELIKIHYVFPSYSGLPPETATWANIWKAPLSRGSSGALAAVRPSTRKPTPSSAS